jgi:hypothetical protein
VHVFSVLINRITRHLLATQRHKIAYQPWNRALLVLLFLQKTAIGNMTLIFTDNQVGSAESIRIVEGSEWEYGGKLRNNVRANEDEHLLKDFNMITIGVRGFDSRRGLRIYLSSTEFRPALEPAQPPIQWLPGILGGG